jgi:hypothetical protein
MRILGPFLSVEDPDTLFFMRGFPDMASRDPMKEKFYEGALWKQELEPVLMPMSEKYEVLEKYEVTLVEDPEGLIRWPVARDEGPRNSAPARAEQNGSTSRRSSRCALSNRFGLTSRCWAWSPSCAPFRDAHGRARPRKPLPRSGTGNATLTSR